MREQPGDEATSSAKHDVCVVASRGNKYSVDGVPCWKWGTQAHSYNILLVYTCSLVPRLQCNLSHVGTETVLAGVHYTQHESRQTVCGESGKTWWLRQSPVINRTCITASTPSVLIPQQINKQIEGRQTASGSGDSDCVPRPTSGLSLLGSGVGKG